MSTDDRQLLMKRLGEEVECVYHPSFRRVRVPEVELRVRGGAAAADATGLAERVEPQREPSLGVSSTEILTHGQEQSLFMRFNYCRARVMSILRRFAGKRLTITASRELLRWERLAREARADIVHANTSLVLAMARRSRNTGVELSELVSEGNLALLRCVDKFDASRGFKFSTYACRAILASFSRAAAKAARHRMQFPAAYDPAMERSDFVEARREDTEREYVHELTQILDQNAASLSPVERRVLDARFALDVQDRAKAMPPRRTLDQVGLLLGVSKERVRQIQNQAMDKLRAALEERTRVAS